MTDRARRRRASKRELRAWAWIAGGLAFFAPWAGLGASPKPAVTAASEGERPVIVIHRITRRVIVHEPAEAPVTFVVTDAAAAAPSGRGTVPAAPATTTGGS